MKAHISEKQKFVALVAVGLFIFFAPLLFFGTRGEPQEERRATVEGGQASEPSTPLVISEKGVEDTPESIESTAEPVGVVIAPPPATQGSGDDGVTTNTEILSDGLPTRLRIPKKSIVAPVISVGVTPDGAMDTPKGPNEVAWFNLGPRPGEVGSAVFSGHYGWKDNIPAVFDNLHTLQKGDKVYVEGGGGGTTVFVVQKVQTYSEYADATAIFTSNDGKAHLNLITCGGIWDKDRKSYSERVVVFTDKE